MASFTDNLVAFNPYVSQVPVDAYTQVGMIKQEQYRQGVEKVQGYIDSISGIEALKPEQKEYIQQRISNLQQEVGKVVQSDFSQQQLINSVGSLTSRIAADPIVKTTIASTDNYKQQLAAIKDAKDKGKSSISNEWEFQDQFQKWYNDKDLTTRFNGAFTPYTDVTKKVADVIKALSPNSHIEDNPFKRDGNGNIEIDSTGRPVIDMAMIKRSDKSLTPERIQAAINANLTPDDVNQLRIDGRYAYRSLDAEGMKDVTDRRFTQKLDRVNDIIEGLLIQRQTTNNDPKMAAEIDAKIEAYKEKATNYQNSYKQSIAGINNNLEGYKGSFYSSDWLTNFGDSYAYAEEALTYHDNPYFQAAERRRENDIKFQEFMIDQQWKAADLNIKKQQLNISRFNAETSRMSAEATVALKAAKTAKGALDGIPLSDAVLAPINQDQIEDINLNSFLTETQDISNEIEQQKMALLGNTGLVTIKRDPDGKNPRYEYNVAGKDPNTVISAADAAMGRLKDAYDKDPNSVPDGVRSYFKTQANADQTVQNRKFALNQVQEEGEKEHPVEQVTNKIPPMRITFSGGGTFYMSGKEQFDFSNKLAGVTTSVPGYGGAGNHSFLDDNKAKELFTTPAEKYAYGLIKKNMEGKALNPAEVTIIKRLGDARGANIIAGSVIKAKNQYVDNAIKSVVGVQEPVNFTLEAFKPEDRNRAKAVAANILADISAAGKSSSGSNFDRGDASKMLQKENDDNTNYSLFSMGRGKYALRMTNENVDKKGINIPLTRAQAEELFGQGKFLDDFYNIRQSLQLTKNTGKWTTDVRNLGKESAFNLDNGQLNRYSVKYHVEEPLKNGGLQVRMYVYDKVAGQWLPERTAGFGQLLNEAQVTKFLSTAGDQYIESVLLKDK